MPETLVYKGVWHTHEQQCGRPDADAMLYQDFRLPGFLHLSLTNLLMESDTRDIKRVHLKCHSPPASAEISARER